MNYQAQENIPPQGYHQFQEGKSSSHLQQNPLWALNPNTDPIKYRTSSPDKSLIKPREQSLVSDPVKPFTAPQDYLKPRSSNSQVISGENTQSLYDSVLRERPMNIQQDSLRFSSSQFASSSLDPFASPKYNKPAAFLSPKSNFDEFQLSHDENERASHVQDTKIISARKETDDFINGLLNKYGIGSMKESNILPTDLYSRPRSFASNNGEFPAAGLRSPPSYIEGAKTTNRLSHFYSPPNQSAKLYYPNFYSVPKRETEMSHQEMSESEIDADHLSSQFYGNFSAKNPYIRVDHNDYLDNQKFGEASVSQVHTRRTLDHTVDENITERRQLTEDTPQTFGTHQNIEDEAHVVEARDSDNIFETERRSIEREIERGHRMVANTIEDEDNNPDGKTSESNAGSDVGDMSSVVLPEEEEEEAIVEALHQKAENQFYENRTFGDEIHDNEDYHSSQKKHIMVDYLQAPPSTYVNDKENTTTIPVINYHYKQQTPEPSQVYSAQITNPYSEEIMRQRNQSHYNTPQENYSFDKISAISPQKHWVSPLQDRRFESPQEEFETSRFKQADFDTFRESERASEMPLQQAQVKQSEIEKEEEEKISQKSESLKEKRSEESEIVSSQEEEVEVEERGSVTTTGKRNMMESAKMWSTFAISVLAIFVWYYLVSIADDWEQEIEERFPDLQ